ncbi:MAG: pilus assembly protein PilP [Desulfobulbaceae bacterium]|nr:pilus assembly protein PilP [Desulfobulbaceae bacterium]
MSRKKFVHTAYIIGVSFLAAGLFAVNSPAEEIASTGKSAASENTLKDDLFNYQLEGRPDPFEPFIRPQVATTSEPDEIIEEDKRLTGMQLFEPGQLKLVAVMTAQQNKLAMVEDVTGKGYIIKEGVLIGRRGEVSRITEDQVIITETARTRAGKELVSTIVMRLNKEGD